MFVAVPVEAKQSTSFGKFRSFIPKKKALFLKNLKTQIKNVWCDRPMFSGLLSIDVVFHFPWRVSSKEDKKLRKVSDWGFHDNKVDLDNLAKPLFDCCTGICFSDDSLIVKASLFKIRTEYSGYAIRFRELKHPVFDYQIERI